MDRTRNFCYSGLWGTLSFFVNFLFGLYLRKLFLQTFDPNLLGYQGTIASIFTILNVAEMGTGTVLTYHLYKALANKNDDEISRYVSIYRYTYQIIGTGIFIVGLVMLFFLPFIFVEPNIAWYEVYVIYVIYLVEVVLNYYLVFRRALFNADQKAWLCSKIDLLCSFASSLFRLLIILYYPDYRIYMAVWVLTTSISNVILTPFYKRQYPRIVKMKVRWQDYKRITFFKDVKWYVVQRLSFVIYNSIDSILIVRFLGVTLATFVSNYSTISASVTSFLERVTSGMPAALGNVVYSDTEDRKLQLFQFMDKLSFGLATIISCSYMYLFQPTIVIWLGNDFLLPKSYVIFFSINQYITYNHLVVTNYRNSVGKYELDTYYMLSSALINLVMSVLFIQVWGLTGLMAATCLAQIIIWIGRSEVVFNEVVTGVSKNHYWFAQAKRITLLLVDYFLIDMIVRFFGEGWTWFLAKMTVCFILPCIVFFVAYRNDSVIYFLKEKIVWILRRLREKQKQQY